LSAYGALPCDYCGEQLVFTILFCQFKPSNVAERMPVYEPKKPGRTHRTLDHRCHKQRPAGDSGWGNERGDHKCSGQQRRNDHSQNSKGGQEMPEGLIGRAGGLQRHHRCGYQAGSREGQ